VVSRKKGRNPSMARVLSRYSRVGGGQSLVAVPTLHQLISQLPRAQTTPSSHDLKVPPTNPENYKTHRAWEVKETFTATEFSFVINNPAGPALSRWSACCDRRPSDLRAGRGRHIGDDSSEYFALQLPSLGANCLRSDLPRLRAVGISPPNDCRCLGRRSFMQRLRSPTCPLTRVPRLHASPTSQLEAPLGR